MEASGKITKILPLVLREAVRTVFSSGDAELDALLNQAVAKYLSPDLDKRKESLEKLWDDWERLKTLENPPNKKVSIETLLQKNDRRKLVQHSKMLRRRLAYCGCRTKAYQIGTKMVRAL